MANARYDATNNNWTFTQTVAADNTYLLHNNTNTTMRVTVSNSNGAVDTILVTLAPGDTLPYSPSQAGTATITGVPEHTTVGALDRREHKYEHEYADANGLIYPTGANHPGRLIFTVI